MVLALTHETPAPPSPRRTTESQLALPGVPDAHPDPSREGSASHRPAPQASAPAGTAWQGSALAGRIVELSGSTGRTSTAVSMLLAKQREGESVVWIEPTDGPLYPPDLAAAGVDLDALVIVRVPTKEGPEGLCRVAEWLVRSGGFGLLVMDLMGRTPAAHNPWQTRLSGLLRRHDAQLCVLSDSAAAAPSLGALVALRLEPTRQRDEDGSFVLSQRVLKNKLGVLQAPTAERRGAPAGLELLPALEDAPEHAQLSLFDTLAPSAPALTLAPAASQLTLPIALPAAPSTAAPSTAAPIPLRPLAPPVVLRPKIAAKRVGAHANHQAQDEQACAPCVPSAQDTAASRDAADTSPPTHSEDRP